MAIYNFLKTSNEKKVIIGHAMCSACQEAKRAFEADGIDFEWIDVTEDPRGYAILAYKGLYGSGKDPVLPVIFDWYEIAELL